MKTINKVLKIRENLLNFINSKIKNNTISEDILQDVLVKVMTKVNTLKDEEKLISWVYQITRNEINTYFRKSKNTNTNEFSGLVADVSDEANLNKEFASCISAMIADLSPKYKEAITKVDINGMSQKEFSTQMNISYSGGKTRVQRARNMIKESLVSCCSISHDKFGNIVDYDKDCNNC